MEATAETGWTPDLDEVRLDDLPPGYREIARELGLEPALKLIGTYGGARLTVPSTLDAGHHLAKRLGLDAARVVAQHAGGTCIHVPSAREATRGARDRAIRADHARGHAWAALVRRYGLAERRIRQIVAGRP